jgi:hypothetical protein
MDRAFRQRQLVEARLIRELGREQVVLPGIENRPRGARFNSSSQA